MKQITLILILIINIFSIARAQQNNTLFFMHKLPQSNLLNPAVQGECNLYLSGLAIPVAGQILPPVYFNYGNNGFAYNQFIHKGTGLQSDSLILDFNNLTDKLRPMNYITAEMHLNLLSLGFRLQDIFHSKFKDYYFTFNITEKADFKFGFPKDLIAMPWQGNGAYINETADFGLRLDFSHYREYALGASKIFNDKLTIGARVKLLYGKLNITTKKNDLSLFTDPDYFNLLVKTDMDLYISQPFVEFNEFCFLYEGDTMIYEDDTIVGTTMVVKTEDKEIDAKDYLLNRKNFGLGIDIGAIYQFNDKITFFASITDFGYIHWKVNVSNFVGNGEFLYQGFDAEPLVEYGDSVFEEQMEGLGDSLIRIFEINRQAKEYNSFLPTKICLGGTYILNDKVYFGLLARTEIYQKSMHSSLTISANSNFYKWLSGCISYSIINNNFKNLGLGLILKGGPIQFYIFSDNILGMQRSEDLLGEENENNSKLIILPYSSRNINFRFGLNLLFGCGREHKTLYKQDKPVYIKKKKVNL